VDTYKRLLTVTAAGLSLVLPTLASDRDDDLGRSQKATQVFQEIMRTPDKGIPRDLLEKAKCVAIIPGEEKAALYSAIATARDWRPVAPPMDGVLLCFWLSPEGASASRLVALSPTW
jgi:hypothetical protein